MNMNMRIIMNMNIYITPDNEKKLQEFRNRGLSMSGLINGLLNEFFGDDGDKPRSMGLALPPVKQEHKESPTIRNLADAVKDDEEEYDEPALYDKARPFWSPFGPLPVRQDPSMPMAVIDPNLDDETRMPLDVDKRNAWLERE